MKTLFIFLITMCCFVSSILAQKPFAELGLDNEVEVITLSNGRYIEYVENDTLRQIGSVMFNMNTNKVEYFIPEDDLEKVRIANRDREVSRFMAVDPLAGEYPHNSPYAFSENRVIDGVELEGLEVKLVTIILGTHPNNEPKIITADVKIIRNAVINNGIIVHQSNKTPNSYAYTHAIYLDEGGNYIGEVNITEPVDYGDKNKDLKGLKASAAYDYSSNSEEKQKLNDDANFIKNYGDFLSWNPVTKGEAYSIIAERDLLAPEQAETLQDLEVLGVLPLFVLPGKIPNASPQQYGVYKQGSGHFSSQHGEKSPAPSMGQLRLDNSVLYKMKQNSETRIGRQGSDFVIFTREGSANSSSNLFHGHVRKWDELDQNMKNFLYQNNYTSLKGKWKN